MNAHKTCRALASALFFAGVGLAHAEEAAKPASSARGDYIGDCFKIIATPAEPAPKLPSGTYWQVQSQSDDKNDPELTIVSATSTARYFCSPKGDPVQKVKASVMTEIGAERLGWTYGMLTLPFKYYAHDKSFASAGSLGPYVGRRSGAAGSAITFAGTLAIGSVKGEVKDSAGVTTDTPELLALSIAAGWMYDISKSPGGKPFKIGLFIGRDYVGAGNAVKYARNGQTWAAFQIGFDFTDN
jgi:hypothetical protein